MIRLVRTLRCDCAKCRRKLDSTFARAELIPAYRLVILAAVLIVVAMVAGVELS